MKLNFYQAWHYHYIAKIKQPFKLWLKTKPQGKMKFFGEVMENRMYDVPEADDNEEFQKWTRLAKHSASGAKNSATARSIKTSLPMNWATCFGGLRLRVNWADITLGRYGRNPTLRITWMFVSNPQVALYIDGCICSLIGKYVIICLL